MTKRQSSWGHAGMGFGKWIRTRREAAAITLNDFSRRLDISPAYWSRIEREMEKPPKDELIEKAVQALGLSLDQAFIQARRFPPDMQRDIATAVHAYRTYKQLKDEN